MKISYLGPKWSWSELAAELWAMQKGIDAEMLPLKNELEVVKSLKSGIADLGVVAHYNLLEGLVQSNLDMVYGNGLRIAGFQRVAIKWYAGKYPEGKAEAVYTHQKALGQCSEWLSRQDVRQIPVESTSAGAVRIAREKSGMAIARKEALEGNGLEVIAEDIGNRKYGLQNYTDFYVLSANGYREEYEEGKDYRTLAAITPHFDEVGLLAKILAQVAFYRINNSDIHSRPAVDDIKALGGDGPKMFYIEMVCHEDEERFRRCIDSLKYLLGPETVRVLGSYCK